MSILGKIILRKKSEVRLLRERYSLQDFEKMPLFSAPVRSLSEALLKSDSYGIIAEFKRRSPSKGVINETSEVAEVTAGYAAHGAAGLSVLTDKSFFGGMVTDLTTARENRIPVLRKDFIIDEYQVLEAKSIGADAILLIAEALDNDEIKKLSSIAHSLGLEVLLELHSEEEIRKIDPSVNIIGINNRDLRSFQVDVNVSLKMSDLLPPGIVKISESGLSSTETLQMLKRAGYNGFLMGELFMATPDPVKAFSSFIKKLE